jgi:hypothetical protein
MKPAITLIAILCLFAFATKAQTVPSNKVDNSLAKANTSLNSVNSSVNNASATGTNAVNTAGNAAASAKNLAGQVGGLFGKKPADGPVNTTVITVKNAKFGLLKQITENVQSCTDVQDAKMKYSSDGSTITVSHTGTTTKLLKEIQKKSPLITDDVIDNIDDGIIAVTLK